MPEHTAVYGARCVRASARTPSRSSYTSKALHPSGRCTQSLHDDEEREPEELAGGIRHSAQRLLRIVLVSEHVAYLFYFLLLCFNVLGTNRGPTDRIQHLEKH